jgi:voltage-gated potassium channel
LQFWRKRRGAAKTGRIGKTRPDIPAWRQQWYDKFSAASELPMLVLTVVMIPALIIPFVWHHGAIAYGGLLEAVDYLIWSIFMIEYVIKLTLAPTRRQFVRKNIPDLIVVAVPFLRPLRIVRSVRALRFLRLARLGAFADKGVTKTKRSLQSKAGTYVFILAGTILVLTSVVVLDLEQGVPNASIKNFGDALWWGISTMTTVGYGDKVPVTPGGKAIAAVLMLTGVAIYGVLAATMATFFVKQADKSGESALDEKLSEILVRLGSIEAALAGPGARVSAANHSGVGTGSSPEGLTWEAEAKEPQPALP